MKGGDEINFFKVGIIGVKFAAFYFEKKITQTYNG